MAKTSNINRLALFTSSSNCIIAQWKQAFDLYGAPKGLTFDVRMHKDNEGNLYVARKINKNGHLTVDVICTKTNEVVKTYLHKTSNLNVRTINGVGKELHKRKFDKVNELIDKANSKRISKEELLELSNKI